MNSPAKWRRKSAAIAAVVVVAAAIFIPAGINSATASPSKGGGLSSPAVKPTIVLVHGAWADGSSFAVETAALQLAGYKVLVAPNPLRSLAGDTKVLSDFLKQRTSGPVVIAAHSYGGMVMTGAAQSDPDVKALVYIDAYAPAAGDSTQSLTNAQPGSLLNVPDASTVFDFVLPAPNAPQAEWDAYIKADKFKSIFAASLPTAITNTLAVSQSPATLGAIGTPFSGTPGWTTIPSYFYIGTADKLLPPAEQLIMAKRANGYIMKGDAPHLAMLAKPADVTSLIIRAAKSAG